ncbi:MAG: proliferating cell nuclear antigen (pcna) [Candidatus Woesearchaeota archaeon]|jgi:proliferating cell nuclear antigen
MKLTLAEPRLLKDSISIISDLVTETKIKITKDFIELVAMDPANVAMVIFKMPSSCFAEYEVKEDTTIAINLNNFKQVLRRVKPSDVLILEKADNKLKITMKEKSTRTFYLPLIDLEERAQKIPQLTSKAIVEFPCSVLNEAIEDMDIVGESVTFLVQKEKLTVSSSGDLTKADVVINSDKEIVITTESDQKSKYSIEYLKKMMQGSKLASKAILKLSNDYPLTLEYKETDKLSLMFILAPRVDND